MTDRKKFIYVDAAASALKSGDVIGATVDFWQNHYANAGRGVCERASFVDKMVEKTRESVATFVGAEANQIVFTTGTTDGMNRIARILDKALPGNKTIMVSDLDHHSARMPFENIGTKILLCPLDDEFNVSLAGIESTDIFVITAMSNVLGVAQDVKKIIAAARSKNPSVITVVDAAQYVAHEKINVTDWDCDFMCFSGHKIGADTGLGVMYVKEPPRWNPDKFGGGMISRIEGTDWVFESAPLRFEAGTLPLSQISGLGIALEECEKYRNKNLIEYLRAELEKLARINFVSPKNSSMLTFTVKDMTALDFGVMVGAHGVCLRVGNMCASWLHKRLGLGGTIRISMGPWNTMEEMTQLVDIIGKVLSN